MMMSLIELHVDSMDQDGRGVARHDNKVVFIDGAILGEDVQVVTTQRKPSYNLAECRTVLRSSAMREVPRCEYFGVCGGCALQHLSVVGQVAIKQRVLEDNLAHLGKIKPERILSPIQGSAWGYRHRARLSVRYMIKKKGRVLVGFHEKRSRYVADMAYCHVLPPHVAGLIPKLSALIGQLNAGEQIPQIEMAVGHAVTVFVLRHMVPLDDHDRSLLKTFALQHHIQWWLQSEGLDSVVPFFPLDAPELTYELPEFGLSMHFRPTDFTQVNHAMNRVMVSRAIGLLALKPSDLVADLFCGLGNFSLPIARQGVSVLGIEGSQTLVDRAADNARRHQLEHYAQFRAMNLFEMSPSTWDSLGRFNKLLIDPPRDGALALVTSLNQHVERIVYVSCNSATLARDAAILVNKHGFRLESAGILNMFPHTGHVESMALFVR